MPYIPQSERDLLQDDGFLIPNTPGGLNYVITELCVGYLRAKGLNYTHINDIMGALSSAQAEFYRRVAVPYEDTKIKENGDVYDNQSSPRVS